ncbi:MAG: hypothetical protein LBH18_00925 [Spirochaetaceae bacterium]|nr:hypothetical protein [Spirochaetaceae bacterium]
MEGSSACEAGASASQAAWKERLTRNQNRRPRSDDYSLKLLTYSDNCNILVVMKDAAFANTTNRLTKKTPCQTSLQRPDSASEQTQNVCNAAINPPPPPNL